MQKETMVKYHRSYSDVIPKIVIIVIILAVLGGLILGWVFPTKEIIEPEYSFRDPEIKNHFNWMLMFIVWLIGLGIEGFLAALYAHIRNQEIQIDNQRALSQDLWDIEGRLAQIQKLYEKTESTDTNQ